MVGLFFSLGGLAQTEPLKQKKSILVVIGYADELHDQQGYPLIFSHRHHSFIAKETEAVLQRLLLSSGFTQSGSEFNSDDFRVVLLNANTQCPGENPATEMNTRRFLCTQQRVLSEKVVAYLDQHLTQFNYFFYIGHARRGMGLGVGPFIEEYTFPLQFYNRLDLGALEKIVLASCDSESYYNLKIYKKHGIQFRGIAGKKLWMQDQLPILFEEINNLLFESRYRQVIESESKQAEAN